MDREWWTSVGRGAAVAVIGAALTAFIQYAGSIDFGAWTPFVASGLAVLTNIVRKWQETKAQ